MSKIRTFLKHILITLMIVVPIYCILSVRLQTSETIASGIVYNNQNNSIFSSKVFTMVLSPWHCVDNVKVERLN